MNAAELSEETRAKKVAIFSDGLSVWGMDADTASGLKDLVDTLIPAEFYEGYIILDGESIVFTKNSQHLVIAVVEEDRIKWCLKKIKEYYERS